MVRSCCRSCCVGCVRVVVVVTSETRPLPAGCEWVVAVVCCLLFVACFAVVAFVFVIVAVVTVAIAVAVVGGGGVVRGVV